MTVINESLSTGSAFTGTLIGGSGDNLSNFVPSTGQVVQVTQGTAASPIGTPNPAIKASYTQSVLSSAVTGDGDEALAAIYGISKGLAASQVQAVGVNGTALNSGTTFGQTDSPDASGLFGLGRITGSGVGVAIGATVIGRSESSAALISGIQITSYNNRGTNDTVTTTGFGPSVGAWIVPAGANKSAAGIQFGAYTTAQYDTGIYFNAQIGSYRGDLVTLSTGTTTVNDTAVVAGDLGAVVTGFGIPANTFIQSVSAGVSFVLSATPTQNVTEFISFMNSRVDSCTTNSTATVTDTTCLATDVGRVVTGANIPANTVILSVTPLTSFVMSNAATTSTTLNLTLTRTGPTVTQDIRSDSTAATSLLINGTHSTAAIATAAGAGSTIIGGIANQSGALIEVQTAVPKRPLASIGTPSSVGNLSLFISNATSQSEYFVVSATNAILTGTASGDSGIRVVTSSAFWHVGGTISTIKVGQANTLGFFNATAVVQQTSAANVHTVAAGSTTTVFVNTTFDGSTGSTAYTVGDIVKALKAYGLLTT